MKIEICENTRNLVMALATLCALVAMAISGCHTTEETTRKYVEAGLVQEASPLGVVWTNPKQHTP